MTETDNKEMVRLEARLKAALAEVARLTRWRHGRHYPIHVYEGDRFVATFANEADARRVVEAVNDAAARVPAHVEHAAAHNLNPDGTES